MSNYTSKKELQEFLRHAEECQQLTEIVKDKLAKFSHYKVINKRFFDSFEGSGVSGHMYKDGYFTRVYFRFDRFGATEGIRLSYHNQTITPELLLNDLSSQKYKHWCDEYKARLANYDEDIGKVRKLIEFAKALNIKNFGSLVELRDLQRVVDYERA